MSVNVTYLLPVLCSAFLLVSCSVPRTGGVPEETAREVRLSLPSDFESIALSQKASSEVSEDSARFSEGPSIMNAIRDDRTGEMVATDVIRASRVTARFRHVAERFGSVSIEFDVTVPSAVLGSGYQLRFQPVMTIMQDTLCLDKIFITGEKYRNAQLRGYQRYRAFLDSIIDDPNDLVRIGQLEIFLQRYFPETFAMKTDSTIISDVMAANCFGVTQAAVFDHYKRHVLMARNERRKQNADKMFRKLVPAPIVTDHVRLDTVIHSSDSAVIYRYRQDVASRPYLKKIIISLDGAVYEADRMVSELKSPEDLTFYVSSLSTLCDDRPHYYTKVISRNVYDHTLALIDFDQGSSRIDTTLADNAVELRRISRCVDDMMSIEGYVTDSIIVRAHCSPEGPYKSNERLARLRSIAVKELLSQRMDVNSGILVSQAVAEDWDLLEVLVRNDSVLDTGAKERIVSLIEGNGDRDEVERSISSLPQYRYLREKLYPRLRRVDLEFHLHIAGMEKDTVHTTELDTIYMNGLKAMENLEYKRAATLLRPYEDYNCALALVCAGYNMTAAQMLDNMKQRDARTDYLSAIVLSRLGKKEEALKYYKLSVAADPAMVHRANLDPELSEIVNDYNTIY